MNIKVQYNDYLKLDSILHDLVGLITKPYKLLLFLRPTDMTVNQFHH